MTARDYAAMFRHVVDRLRANGVTNAVSTLTYMSYEKWNNMPWWYDLYPGDAWVDWITLDAYVNAQPGGFHSGDFNYLVNRTTNKARSRLLHLGDQPAPEQAVHGLGVGRVRLRGRPDPEGGDLREGAGAAQGAAAIKGLMYFDAANAPGAPGDLRVNSSPGSLTEFRKIAPDPTFNVKVK